MPEKNAKPLQRNTPLRTNILVTGASGYIGRLVAEKLSQQHNVVGISRKGDKTAPFPLLPMDIRDTAIVELLRKENISHVVHLAAVLEDNGNRELAYDIDVNGTRNLLNACCDAGVQHITISSSGAAYGYHADNPEWLQETDALRGNTEFSYSDHKRLIEEMLADYSTQQPQLKQLILRVCTVLGAETDNLITALFERPRLLSIRGSSAPFVVIWDEDLANIIEYGVANSIEGIFNVAGDGALSMKKIARLMNKPLLSVPASLMRAALRIGKTLKLTRYGPEQLKFLQYRPVLDNQKLTTQFGYPLQKSSLEAFEYWRDTAAQRASRKRETS